MSGARGFTIIFAGMLGVMAVLWLLAWMVAP
jgi:Na+-transporting methylmalonyl-CoA/oxaloacetate decarboxylase gamma subunit